MAEDLDFYETAAWQRLNEIEACQAQEMANLAAYKAQGYDGLANASISVQSLANLTAEKNNLLALHQQHQQSKIPVQQPQLTAAERDALPPEKMTWADSYELAKRGSKHGVDDAAFQRGIQEVMRRRQKGE
jgi:hypothetical protein